MPNTANANAPNSFKADNSNPNFDDLANTGVDHSEGCNGFLPSGRHPHRHDLLPQQNPSVVVPTELNYCENDIPLIASLAYSIFGGAFLALTALILGSGPVLAAVSYSFGGAAVLVLSAMSIAARSGRGR